MAPEPAPRSPQHMVATTRAPREFAAARPLLELLDGTASVWECVDGEFDCMASLEGHDMHAEPFSITSEALGALARSAGGVRVVAALAPPPARALFR